MGFKRVGDKLNQQAQSEAVQEAKLMWDALITRKNPYWLTLGGVTGCGKTHIAKRLRKAFGLMTRLQKQGDIYLGPGSHFYTAEFYHWPTIAEGFMQGSYEVLQDMAKSWFLVIDDVGATRSENSKIEDLNWDKLFTLLSRRENMWTVVTTNLRFEEVVKAEPRLADRLIRGDNRAVKCGAKSYSRTKSLKNEID